MTNEPIGKVKVSSMFANEIDFDDGMGNSPSDPFNKHIVLTTIDKNSDGSDNSLDYDANENMSEKVAYTNKPQFNEAGKFEKYQGLTDEELDAQLAAAIQTKNEEEQANHISTINEDSRDVLSGDFSSDPDQLNNKDECDVPSSQQSEIPETVRQNFDNFNDELERQSENLRKQ